MMRQYVNWMFFILLAFFFMEAYRARRRPLYFVLGCLACFFSSQAHEVAIMIFVVPAICLLWDVLRIPWAFRKADLTRPAARVRPFVVLFLLATSLLLVSLLALQYRLGKMGAYNLTEELTESIGSTWTKSTAQDLPAEATPSPTPAPSTPSSLTPRTPEQILSPAPRNSVQIPKFSDWLYFSRISVQRTYSMPLAQWSGASLFWLSPSNRGAWLSMVAGPSVRLEMFPEGGPLEIAILLSLAASSLILLFRSPPLVVACWVCITANGLAIYLHQNRVPSLSDRYFSLAAICILLLLCGGFSAAFMSLRAPLTRRRPRLAAYLTLFCAFALGASAFVAIKDWSRTCSAYWNKSWGDPSEWGVIHHALTSFPQDALVYGTDDQNVEFLRRWELYRHRANNGTFWTAPTRIGLVDSWTNRNLHGLALLERLNSYAGFVFYSHEKVHQDYDPFLRYASLFPPRRLEPAGRWQAASRPMDRKLFVTRAHTILPLMPRFTKVVDQSTSPVVDLSVCDYHLDAYFETPGRYRMAIDVTPSPVR